MSYYFSSSKFRHQHAQILGYIRLLGQKLELENSWWRFFACFVNLRHCKHLHHYEKFDIKLIDQSFNAKYIPSPNETRWQVARKRIRGKPGNRIKISLQHPSSSSSNSSPNKHQQQHQQIKQQPQQAHSKFSGNEKQDQTYQALGELTLESYLSYMCHLDYDDARVEFYSLLLCFVAILTKANFNYIPMWCNNPMSNQTLHSKLLSKWKRIQELFSWYPSYKVSHWTWKANW